jgi:hypothetical protein
MFCIIGMVVIGMVAQIYAFDGVDNNTLSAVNGHSALNYLSTKFGNLSCFSEWNTTFVAYCSLNASVIADSDKFKYKVRCYFS